MCVNVQNRADISPIVDSLSLSMQSCERLQLELAAMDPVNRHSINRYLGPVAAEKNEPKEEEPPFFVIGRLFPRIATAIELMWGNRELDDYLHKLIMVDRGDRAGFPNEVLAALLKLHNQHMTRFKFQKREDAWAQEDRMNRVKN